MWSDFRFQDEGEMCPLTRRKWTRPSCSLWVKMCGGGVQGECWRKGSREEKESKGLLHLRSLDVLIFFLQQSCIVRPAPVNLSKSEGSGEPTLPRVGWVQVWKFSMRVYVWKRWLYEPNPSKPDSSFCNLTPPPSSCISHTHLWTDSHVSISVNLCCFFPPHPWQYLITVNSWSGENVCDPPLLEKMQTAELLLVSPC